MVDLEKQTATEEEFDKYVLDKIDSSLVNDSEAFGFFRHVTRKNNLKKLGYNLKFYRDGDRVSYYIVNK